MERTAVNSSHIVAIGYDEPNRVLEVEFKGALHNRVYRYAPVSPQQHSDLMGAESVGRTLNALIKSDPHITAVQVELVPNAEASRS